MLLYNLIVNNSAMLCYKVKYDIVMPGSIAVKVSPLDPYIRDWEHWYPELRHR